MRRRSEVIAALAAGAILPVPLRAQEFTKIRLVAVPSDDQTPLHYAMLNGRFGGAGLDVDIEPAPGGTAGTTAVIAGTYDIGKGSVMGSLVGSRRSRSRRLRSSPGSPAARAPIPR